MEPLTQFAAAKYISVETFRKTGAGVRTPVWFAEDPAHSSVFYIYSAPDAGKVKRIRNNPFVRVAPCDFRGNVKGNWMDGTARICAGEEAQDGQVLLRRKYWLKIGGDFVSRLLGRKQVVIAIVVEAGSHL